MTDARKKPTKVVNIFDNCKFIVNKCYINLTFAYLSYNFGLFGNLRLAVQRNAQGVGCGKEKKEYERHIAEGYGRFGIRSRVFRYYRVFTLTVICLGAADDAHLLCREITCLVCSDGSHCVALGGHIDSTAIGERCVADATTTVVTDITAATTAATGSATAIGVDGG